MKALMYHYVRPGSGGLPQFYYLHLDDFRRQLTALREQHRFISRGDFLEALSAGQAPKNDVVLTFDDGLKDHAQWVVPELERQGLWGIFYVPTGPFSSNQMLDVHRVHYLLGLRGGTEMIARLARHLEDSMLVGQRVEEFREQTYALQDNPSNVTLFKRTMNYFIAEEWRTPVLNLLWAEESDVPKVGDWYLSEAELAGFETRGMLVGSHSVSHRVFSTLSETEQRHEVAASFDFLDDRVGGLLTRTFCYPFGGFHSFNATTERLLGEVRCRFSFNVEPRSINERDLRERPQALPRFDCNQFPHGQASLG